MENIKTEKQNDKTIAVIEYTTSQGCSIKKGDRVIAEIEMPYDAVGERIIETFSSHEKAQRFLEENE